MAAEIPTGEGSVFHFLDIFALGCGLEACAALFRGDPMWKVVLGFAGAIAFHLLGTKWGKIKSTLAPAAVSFLDRAGRNPWVRFVALTLVLGYFTITIGVYVQRLRTDLDQRVMPRHLSKEQAQRLQDYLSKYSFAVEVKVVQNDPEAMEYAAQIFNALRGSNLDVNPPDHGGPEPLRLPQSMPRPSRTDKDRTGKPLYKSDEDYLKANDDWTEFEIQRKIDERTYPDVGISIQEMYVGAAPNTNPDPRVPSNTQILQDAFRNAGIEVSGEGSAYYRDKDELYVLVGHRPMVIGYEEPVLSKVGRWLMREGSSTQ